MQISASREFPEGFGKIHILDHPEHIHRIFCNRDFPEQIRRSGVVVFANTGHEPEVYFPSQKQQPPSHMQSLALHVDIKNIPEDYFKGVFPNHWESTITSLFQSPTPNPREGYTVISTVSSAQSTLHEMLTQSHWADLWDISSDDHEQVIALITSIQGWNQRALVNRKTPLSEIMALRNVQAYWMSFLELAEREDLLKKAFAQERVDSKEVSNKTRALEILLDHFYQKLNRTGQLFVHDWTAREHQNGSWIFIDGRFEPGEDARLVHGRWVPLGQTLTGGPIYQTCFFEEG